jgi:BTB/POZ domain
MLNLIQAESALSLVRDQEDPQAQINWTTFPPVIFDVSDTNLIIRSSDLVDFRVHKSVLAIASPFFKDLLSLPQPSDSESVDGLPVVQLPENSELLNSLISVLYPILAVIPNSYEKVLCLLATYRWQELTHCCKALYLLSACQKYEMASVQWSIRTEIGLGESPVLKGDEAFRAYAIASAKDLIPEMEFAARLTLGHPMTFELLGEGLRLFEGCALRRLVNFRRRWIDIRPKIRQEYIMALFNHGTCGKCVAVQIENGSTFCAELESKLAQTRDKVTHSFYFQVPRTDIHLLQVGGDRDSCSGSTYISPRNR